METGAAGGPFALTIKGNNTIAYNGEVYNYLDLRTELEALGRTFTTDSDTGENRYARLTKDSGIQVGSGYDGRFGYGNGTYIDNTGDRQIPVDEQ